MFWLSASAIARGHTLDPLTILQVKKKRMKRITYLEDRKQLKPREERELRRIKG